jgi:TatD DNase family protein
MIDCHCHFYQPSFPEQALHSLLADAAAAGVAAIVTVPECLLDCHTVLELSRSQPLIAPCAGLHPVQPPHAVAAGQAHSVASIAEVTPVIEFIRSHADELVGIGEVGLDFRPSVIGGVGAAARRRGASAGPPDDIGAEPAEASTPAELREVQTGVLTAQAALACELDLPLNVHSRAAGHHAVSALRAAGARSALLHAFDGRVCHALEGAAAGFFFSAAPSAARDSHARKLLAALPLDNLVLETDAPALAPLAGAVNVPANLVVAARELAAIKQVPLEDVLRITTDNAQRLFPRLRARLQDGCAVAVCGAGADPPS